MRVLTLIDSLAVGGAERSLAMMTPELVERGVDMHVASLVRRDGVGPDLKSGGATVHSLAGPGGRFRAIWRTMRLIRELRPDVLHTTLFEADIVGRVAGRLTGVPTISSFVTEAYGPEHYNNPEYHPIKVRGAHWVDVLTARLVTRFHAVSASAADVMSSRLRVSRQKIDVIHRGRDPKRIGVRTSERRNLARKSLGIDDDTPLILSVGRHYHFKGLDLVVHAMKDVLEVIPNCQLVIAGREGPATPELLAIAEQDGTSDHLSIAGYRSDIADLMCAADVFVLPSRAEGSPGVLIEAMALEVPTVASDIPSVRELVDTDCEVVVLAAFESPKDIAAGIIELIQDPERALELTAAARERYLSRYTMSAIADDTLALYRSVAS